MPANLDHSAEDTGLKKVSFHSIPKKYNAKEYSNYHTISWENLTLGRRLIDSAQHSVVTGSAKIQGKVHMPILQKLPWNTAHPGTASAVCLEHRSS